MSCAQCGGTGFIEGHFAGSASYTPSLEQCPRRCNLVGYSNEVQRRLNNKDYVTERPVLQTRLVKTVAPIIPLRTAQHDFDESR